MSMESMAKLLDEFNKLTPEQQEKFLDGLEKFAQAESGTERKVDSRRHVDVSTDVYYVLSLISSASVLMDYVFEEVSAREQTVDRHGFVVCELLSKAIETLNNVYTVIL